MNLTISQSLLKAASDLAPRALPQTVEGGPVEGKLIVSWQWVMVVRGGRVGGTWLEC